MKITKTELRQIIKEELGTLRGQRPDLSWLNKTLIMKVKLRTHECLPANLLVK